MEGGALLRTEVSAATREPTFARRFGMDEFGLSSVGSSHVVTLEAYVVLPKASDGAGSATP